MCLCVFECFLSGRYKYVSVSLLHFSLIHLHCAGWDADRYLCLCWVTTVRSQPYSSYLPTNKQPGQTMIGSDWIIANQFCISSANVKIVLFIIIRHLFSKLLYPEANHPVWVLNEVGSVTAVYIQQMAEYTLCAGENPPVFTRLNKGRTHCILGN